MASENQNDLLDYLTGLADDNRIESIAEETAPLMRMGGTGEVGNSEASRAREAVKKLSSGKAITSSEQLLIEAIIIPGKRPAALIQNDTFDIAQRSSCHATDVDRYAHRFRQLAHQESNSLGRLWPGSLGVALRASLSPGAESPDHAAPQLAARCTQRRRHF